MRLPVHIWIREVNASPAEIAGYFIEIAQRLDERPQKMRLVVESSVPAILDIDPMYGNPVVSVGDEAYRFDIRRRWLPEHPIPVVFGQQPVVLLIDPIEGNRFRVRSRCGIFLPVWSYAIFAVSATVSVITLHPVAIATTSLLPFLAMVYVALSKRIGD